MSPFMHKRGVRLGAACLAVAGVLFFLYPAIRPFSDEASLRGAQAFASNAWILAHVLAMLGFTLLTLGVLALSTSFQSTPAERVGLVAVIVCWLGAGLTLPFYGAEAFGLHVIGDEALRRSSPSLLSMANEVRSGPGLVMFLIGLGLLAAGAIMVALAVWKSGILSKWSGFPLALGIVLYVPQFFGTQSVRVAHGLLVAAGCLWIAAGMWRVGKAP